MGDLFCENFSQFFGWLYYGLGAKVQNALCGNQNPGSYLCFLLRYHVAFHLSRVLFAGSGDPARLAAQVVSGIGFLGGGAILREGFNVKGLTSAAIIWTGAALGLSIGAGFLFPAFVALIFSLVALILIEFLEEHFFPAEELKVLYLTCTENQPTLKDLKPLAAKYGVIVTNLNNASLVDNVLKVSYEARIPKSVDFENLAQDLRQRFKVTAVELR